MENTAKVSLSVILRICIGIESEECRKTQSERVSISRKYLHADSKENGRLDYIFVNFEKLRNVSMLYYHTKKNYKENNTDILLVISPIREKFCNLADFSSPDFFLKMNLSGCNLMRHIQNKKKKKFRKN